MQTAAVTEDVQFFAHDERFAVDVCGSGLFSADSEVICLERFNKDVVFNSAGHEVYTHNGCAEHTSGVYDSHVKEPVRHIRPGSDVSVVAIL